VKRKTSLPFVSITITTKNEEKNIANCLQSIKKQTYPQEKIEIIVVDNKSLDQTKQIAKKYTRKVFNRGPERSSQRNFGFKKSRGKYLIFLDADMTLTPKVVTQATKKLENSDLIALYIPEIVLGDSFLSRVRRFERSFYDGTIIDCVRFIKKQAFKKTGGFDLSLSGPEDWDLDKKIRQIGKTGVLKKKGAAIYHNETDFSLRNYLRKKAYYSQSFPAYIKKWGKEDPDIKKQFGFKYRYLQVFMEKGKWQKLIKQPILTLGMYFLKLLVGLVYLGSKLKD